MSLPSHTTLNEAGVPHGAKRETRRAERMSTFVAVPASQVTCERDNLPPPSPHTQQQQQQQLQQPSTTQATTAVCGETGSNGSVAIEREASCGAPLGNARDGEAVTNAVMCEGEEKSHSEPQPHTRRRSHATRRPAQPAARHGSTARTQTQQQQQPTICTSNPSVTKDIAHTEAAVMSQPACTSHVECADSTSFSHTSSRSPPPSAAPTTQMSPAPLSHSPAFTPAAGEHTEEEDDGKEHKSHNASLPTLPLTSSVIVLDNSFSAAATASASASASSSLAMTRCPPCALPTTREATLGLTHRSMPSEESATKTGAEMPAHTSKSNNHTFASSVADANTTTTTLLAESSKDPAVPCALAPLPSAELTEAELTSTSYSLRFSSVTSDDVRRTLARGLALGGVEFHVDLSAQSSLTTNLNTTTTTTNTNTTTTMSFMRPSCATNNNNNSCSISLCSRRGSDVRNSLSGITGDGHTARRRTGRHMTHYLISTIEERPATTTNDGAAAEEGEAEAAAAGATNSNNHTNEAAMTHVTVMRPVLVDESDACPRFLAARASEGAGGERRLLPLYHSCRDRSLTLWLSEQHEQHEEQQHPLLPRVPSLRPSEQHGREHEEEEEEGTDAATTSAARPASSTHTHLPAAVPSLNSTAAEDGLVHSSHSHEAHASTQASETGGGESSAPVFLRTACTGRRNANNEHRHLTHVHHVMSGGSTGAHEASASAAQVLPSVLPPAPHASPTASSTPPSSSPCGTHTGHNNNNNNNNGDRSAASGGGGGSSSTTPMLRSTAQAYITGSSLPSSLRVDDTMDGMMGSGNSSSQAMLLTAAEGGGETRGVRRGGGGGDGEDEGQRRPVAGPLLHALDGPDNALLSGTAPHPLHTAAMRATEGVQVTHTTPETVATTRPVTVMNTINNTNTMITPGSDNGQDARCETATAALIAPDRPRSHTPTDPFGMPVIVFPPLVVHNNNNTNASEGGEGEHVRAGDEAEEDVVVHNETQCTATHAGVAAESEAVVALPTPSAAGTSWSTTATSREGDATARTVARHRALLRTFPSRTALHDTSYEEDNNDNEADGGHAAWATHSRTTTPSGSTALSPSLHSIRTTSEGRAARAAVLRAPMSPLPRVRRADGTLRTTAERRVFSRRPLPRGLLFSESSGSHRSRSTNSNDIPDEVAADEEEDDEEEEDYNEGTDFFVPPAEEAEEGAVVRCAPGLHAMLLEGREPERVGHLLRPSTSIVDRYAAL